MGKKTPNQHPRVSFPQSSCLLQVLGLYAAACYRVSAPVPAPPASLRRFSHLPSAHLPRQQVLRQYRFPKPTEGQNQPEQREEAFLQCSLKKPRCLSLTEAHGLPVKNTATQEKSISSYSENQTGKRLQLSQFLPSSSLPSHSPHWEGRIDALCLGSELIRTNLEFRKVPKNPVLYLENVSQQTFPQRSPNWKFSLVPSAAVLHLQRKRAQVSVLFYNWDWWNETESTSSRWLTAHASPQGCCVLLSVQCADQKNEIKKFLFCFCPDHDFL